MKKTLQTVLVAFCLSTTENSIANEFCAKTEHKTIRSDGKTPLRWRIEKEGKVYIESCLFKTIGDLAGNRYRHVLLSMGSIESRLNPNINNGSKGEKGPFQLLPSTVSFLNSEYNIKIRPEILEDNIYGAKIYFDFLEKKITANCGIIHDSSKYQDLLFGSYNAGHGHLKKGCDKSVFPISTQKYITNVKTEYAKTYIAKNSLDFKIAKK